MHTIIIGSGISGLTTAVSLIGKNIPKEEVLVLEAGSRPGGLIDTVQRNGYLLESGPEGLRGNAPHVYQLISMINADAAVIPSSPATSTRYLVHKGKLQKVPEGPLQAITTPLLSFKGKMRILKEPFVKSQDIKNESIGDFLVRRFGEGIDPLLDAFMSGVYAGDHKELNADFVFPMLKDLERKYGSIIKGGMKAAKEAKKQKKRKPQEEGRKKEKPPFLLSFKGGMGWFIKAMAERVNVKYNTRVTSIVKTKDGYNVKTKDEEYHAQHVVLAVNPYQASKIDVFQNQDLAKVQIRRAPVAIVALGYDERAFKKRPKGYGFLAPSREKVFMLGTLFSSDIFPHHAPKGKVLLRVFVGGIRYPEKVQLSQEELIDSSIHALKQLLPFTDDAQPEFTHVTYQKDGIAQMEKQHMKIAKLKEELEHENPGFYMNGIGWTGISTDHLINDGIRIAEAILQEKTIIAPTF